MAEETESGFITNPEDEFGIYDGFTDIEIIKQGSVNIIAVGRRYGRRWLLKGLRAELRNSVVHRHLMQKEFEIQSRFRESAVARVVEMEEVGDLGPCIIQE